MGSVKNRDENARQRVVSFNALRASLTSPRVSTPARVILAGPYAATYIFGHAAFGRPSTARAEIYSRTKRRRRLSSIYIGTCKESESERVKKISTLSGPILDPMYREGEDEYG